MNPIDQKDITKNSVPSPPTSTGLRFNKGKDRYDLIPTFPMQQLAKILTKGAEKYAERNWEKGMKWSTCIASLERHFAAFKNGEDYDKESGCLHIAHALCNAAFITEYYKSFPQGDDRPHSYLQKPRIGLDIDEVICDFVGGWAKVHGTDVSPHCWGYHRDMMKEFTKMKDEGILNDFYLRLDPKINPKDLPFEPCAYVTSRPIPSEITTQWLDKHGFPAAAVYTVSLNESKVDIIKAVKIDIFVDDRYENFIELNKAGICCFLFDCPHNQKYKNIGYKRIKSLNDIFAK